MSTTTQVKAKGTKLQMGNTDDHTTASTWTGVGVLDSVKPPMRTADKIDVTSLESDDVESLPGLPDSGDLEATIQYAPANATTLDTAFNVKKAWRVLYPPAPGTTNNTGRKFTGWISELGESEVKNKDIIRQSVKITVTGPTVSFTEAVSPPSPPPPP